jgi:hypothetical protein
VRRRVFLVATASLLAVPVSLRVALAAGDAGAELLAAWGRARAAGRPLLVIVVLPAEQGRQEQLWGGLISTAGDATMARLGQCEVVCATPEAVTAAFGLQGGQAWAWVVPPAGPAAAVSGTPTFPTPVSAAPTPAPGTLLAPTTCVLQALLATPPACDGDDLSGDILPFVTDLDGRMRRTCGAAPEPALVALEAAARDAQVALGMRRARSSTWYERYESDLSAMAPFVEELIGRVAPAMSTSERFAAVDRGKATLYAQAPGNARWATPPAAAPGTSLLRVARRSTPAWSAGWATSRSGRRVSWTSW